MADFLLLGAHGGPREPWDGLPLEAHHASKAPRSERHHARKLRPAKDPPGPADEEHPLKTGHDAIGKEKQTGGRRQGTEKDLGPKSGDRRLGT